MCTRLFFIYKICEELGKICGDLFIVMRNVFLSILLFRSIVVPQFVLWCVQKNRMVKIKRKMSKRWYYTSNDSCFSFSSECFVYPTFISFSNKNMRTECIIQQHSKKCNSKSGCRWSGVNVSIWLRGIYLFFFLSLKTFACSMQICYTESFTMLLC